MVAKHFNADLSKTAEVESMCDQITELYPEGIDILVNNAGKSDIEVVFFASAGLK